MEYEAFGRVHKLVWREYGITMQIDRIVEDSRYNMIGEWTIKRYAEPLMRHGRSSLTSATGRHSFAKQLVKMQENIPEQAQVPWGTIIEQACNAVIEKEREGALVSDTNEVQPRERSRYRVGPIILEGEPNLLYGKGDIGKSLIAAYVAVLISSGASENGWKAEQGNVLILDYEMDEAEWAERLRAIEKGGGFERKGKIVHRFCTRPIEAEIETIQAIVADNQIHTAIIDPLARAVGGDTTEEHAITGYFDALRSLEYARGYPVTTVSIDHTNREGTLYGSSYKFHCTRCMFALKTGDKTDDSFSIGFFHEKMNVAPKLKPFALQANLLTDDDGRLDQVTFYRLKPEELPEIEKELKDHERIWALLGNRFVAPDGSLTVVEIAEELDMKPNYVRNVLSRFKDRMFVSIDMGAKAGRWARLAK